MNVIQRFNTPGSDISKGLIVFADVFITTTAMIMI